jgi:hypothetical protein
MDVGTSLLVWPTPREEPNMFSVRTVEGQLLGRYRFSEADLPSWWNRTSLTRAVVTGLEEHEGQTIRVRVEVEEL